VHYPSALCDAIASSFAAAFLRVGLRPQSAPTGNLAARAFAQNQPASNKDAFFLPDYKHKFVRLMHNETQIWPSTSLDFTATKLLHSLQVGGNDMQQLALALQTQCVQWLFEAVFENLPDLPFPCLVTLQMFGKMWSEEEFVCRALESKHPLAVEDTVPWPLIEAIQFNSTSSKYEIAKLRTVFLSKWSLRAKQLHQAEMNLKQTMDHGPRRCPSSAGQTHTLV